MFPSSSHARVSWCTTRTCIRTQRLPPPPPHTRHSHGTPRMERSSEERGRGFSLSGEKIHSRSFAGNHRVRSTCILYSGFLPALFSRRAHDRKARIILDTVLLPFLVFARRSVNYDRLLVGVPFYPIVSLRLIDDYGFPLFPRNCAFVCK